MESSKRSPTLGELGLRSRGGNNQPTLDPKIKAFSEKIFKIVEEKKLGDRKITSLTNVKVSENFLEKFRG